ncbi:MAG TPA: hypothetical protein VF038_17020 [Usitatibacter sp.]|jgi:hypothetical protein
MKTSAFLVATLVLSACASYSGYGLRTGSSTESDVRTTMGPPALEIAENGGKELFYPKGPLGTQTFAVHVDAQGRLAGIDQVLDDDHFRPIHEGQTRDEVLRRIGPPGDRMRYPNGTDAWIYRYTDTWGYTADFYVSFNPQGIVVSKISIRLEPNDDNDR